MLEEFMSLLLLSLLLGSLYSMMGLGITMTFKIVRFANFAHAELVTIGAYVSVMMINMLGGGVVGAAVCSFLASALLALAMDELVYKPMAKRGASALYLLTASIGVGLFVRYVLSIFADIYGMLCVQSKRMPTRIAELAGADVTDLHVWVIATLIGIVTLLHLMLTRTKLGKAMRATACNFELAQASGIDTDLVRRVTWIIAGGLAGLAGMFWSIYAPINPEVGWRYLLWAFAASILGGMTSFYGTIAAGIIGGLAEVFGITLANRLFGVSLSYRWMISFIIVIVVLLVNPRGLAAIRLEALREWLKAPRLPRLPKLKLSARRG
ncbi:MAG TPA: branched-chain amino acid ABC transporter permease [Candidatus Bathyarchaeota archaeon]|nr:branched-chain amino acid ABC transporter permease [Candidatus Bathyarchaeota archaeon]